MELPELGEDIVPLLLHLAVERQDCGVSDQGLEDQGEVFHTGTGAEEHHVLLMLERIQSNQILALIRQ